MALAARAAAGELRELRAVLDPDVELLDRDGEPIRQASLALRRQLGTVDAHLSWDPFYQLGLRVPVLGGQLRAVETLLEMGKLVANAGVDVAVVLDVAEEAKAEQHEGVALPQLARNVLERAGPSLDRLDITADALLARRLELGDRPLLPPLERAREEVDEQLPQIVDAAERLALARKVLPAMLGFEGERRYLVLLLNEGELLPGGGLVTGAGVLVLRDGIPQPVDFFDSTRWLPEWEAKGGEYLEPPGPLKRYLLRDFGWNLLVSNWSPDFPTWSRQALEFYELVFGPQDVDGILALDLATLVRFLGLTGPQELGVEGRGVVTFTPENAVFELERLTVRPFGEREDRKEIISELANVMLQELLHLPPDRWGDALRAFADLAETRDLQMLSFEPREQAFLRDLGLDGALRPVASDYLQINQASVHSTKLNLFLRPEGRYEVEVDELGDAHHRLELRVRYDAEAWAAGKDAELIDRLMIGALYGEYQRLFVPPSAVAPRVWVDGEPRALEDFGEEGSGHRWWGLFYDLRPGQEREVVWEWSVPAATLDPNSYHLVIQKQPGGPDICFELSVRLAGGESEVELRGGTEREGKVCLTSDVEVTARAR